MRDHLETLLFTLGDRKIFQVVHPLARVAGNHPVITRMLTTVPPANQRRTRGGLVLRPGPFDGHEAAWIAIKKEVGERKARLAAVLNELTFPPRRR